MKKSGRRARTVTEAPSVALGAPAPAANPDTTKADFPPGAPAEAPQTASKSSPAKLALMHDGERFLVDRMHPDTIATFRKMAARTPQLLGAGAGDPDGAGVPPELVAGAFGLISSGLTWLLARSGRFTAAQLEIMELDDKELELVTPPAQKVIDKYLPASLLEHSDELTLALAIFKVFEHKRLQLVEIAAAATGPRTLEMRRTAQGEEL